jgi:hypothetical protein
MSVFLILFAIALSTYFNIAINADPESSFNQPKVSSAQMAAGIVDLTKSANYSGTLNIFMLAVDPSLNAITFAYSYAPSSSFLGIDPDDPDSAQNLNKNVKFMFGSQSIQYSFGDESYDSQSKFSGAVTATGIYAFYPADTYSLKNVPVTCRFTQDETAIVRSSPRCPFALSIRSNIKTTFSMEVSDKTGTSAYPADGSSYELDITVSRPIMFRLYPGFVIFAFWLIIIFEFCLITALSFFDFRKVASPQLLCSFIFNILIHFLSQAEFANAALFSALIFALPSFRNSMPLAPPFGSLSDWISFFWAECLAVLGLIIIGMKYENII